MTSLAQALSAALLHFVWQGALVGVLLWLALLILRNRPAAVRYTVACAALAILAILPAVTTWILYETPPPLSTGPAILICRRRRGSRRRNASARAVAPQRCSPGLCPSGPSASSCSPFGCSSVRSRCIACGAAASRPAAMSSLRSMRSRGAWDSDARSAS